MAVQTTPEDSNELSAELFDRSSLVVDLDGPQIEAWVSGLFSAWDDEQAAIRFVEHCRVSGGQVAALLCRAIAELGSGAVSVAATEAAAQLGDVAPESGAGIGRSQALAGWRVSARFGQSVILGFGADDVLGHSLLAEIGEDGLLEDLRLAGPPDELLPGDLGQDDADRAAAGISGRRSPALLIEEIGVVTAAETILAAWRLAAEAPRVWEETVAANEQFARRRIERILEVEVPLLNMVDPVLDLRRGMSELEFSDANRAALSTLRSALGEIDTPAARSDVHDAWISVIHGDVAGLGLGEAEALLYLEWADWLGAGIGLVRGGPGLAVDGASLVDLVNRCPEVSSTIEAADREYTVSAFEVAIEHLAECGAVANGLLTDAGHQALPAAMRLAWSATL